MPQELIPDSHFNLTRSCPSCGATEHGDPIITTPRRAEYLEFEEIKKTWIGFFQQKTLYSYCRCRKCGLLYAPISFNEEQLQELYADMPPNMEIIPPYVLQRTQKGYFSYLKPFLDSQQGSYLEIGPDAGLFTENCLSLDCFDTYWLFEPNKAVKPQLETLMGGQQYHICHELTDLSAIPDGSVAACVIIHVLDHLLRPKDLLVQLQKKLKKGGVLLIVTHDERSFLARIMGSKWPAYSLQHPQIYNLRSIRHALSVTGFEVCKQTKTTNYFPISFLIKNLAWNLQLKFDSLPQIFNFVWGLKLGNILTLATPK